jgi:hypothetical protein
LSFLLLPLIIIIITPNNNINKQQFIINDNKLLQHQQIKPVQVSLLSNKHSYNNKWKSAKEQKAMGYYVHSLFC